MSIIHDALKKVQDKNTPAQPAQNEPAPVSTAETESDALVRGIPRPAMIAIFSAILIAVIVVLGFLFYFARQALTRPKPAAAPIPAPTAMTAVVTNELKLEGIMDTNGKRVALINGNVYEEGQTAQGAKILQILPDSVVIDENGTSKTLTIHQR